LGAMIALLTWFRFTALMLLFGQRSTVKSRPQLPKSDCRDTQHRLPHTSSVMSVSLT
jgi:uncharacterized BrkB/YihY/UPF0761 family membrane protein